MKKYSIASIVIILLIALITIVGCGDDAVEVTTLDLTIISHPEGGVNIQSVSCVVEGELIGGDDPVTVTIDWWWEDAAGLNDELYSTETYTFSENQPMEHTTTYDAPAGFFLLCYWWAEFTWSDDDGSHSIESNKAFCTML